MTVHFTISISAHSPHITVHYLYIMSPKNSFQIALLKAIAQFPIIPNVRSYSLENEEFKT